MFDRILLVLLILLLPLGLFVGRYLLQQQPSEENKEQVTASELQTILSQIKSGDQGVATTNNPINITGVTYATESSMLRVAGVAPSQKLSILVSTTRMPSLNQIATAAAELGMGDDGGVLGRAVEVRSIESGPGGSFVFEYKVAQASGLIELRFDQGDAQATIQYDLDKRVQTF